MSEGYGHPLAMLACAIGMLFLVTVLFGLRERDKK